MTLSQAFAVLSKSSQSTSLDKVFLICGFQPLHLPTFLKAEFSNRFADRALSVQTGLYNDLEGTFSAAICSDAQQAAVLLAEARADVRQAEAVLPSP